MSVIPLARSAQTIPIVAFKHRPRQQATLSSADDPTPACSELVYNEAGIQMLNRRLHRQIFKNSPLPRPDPRAVVISKEHLRKHGLDITKSSQVPNLSFNLPPLQGCTIDEHFHNLGTAAAEPWLALCNSFVDSELPAKPGHWVIRSGWTRYSATRGPHTVPFPDLNDNALVFDVETLPKYTENPIIAVAVSKNAWYVWLSPWIVGASNSDEHLVPLGPPSNPRLVVGHNISFDRARIYEEYSLEQTSTRFMDTMALHIAVNGMTAGQRIVWNKLQKARLAMNKEQSADILDQSLTSDFESSSSVKNEFTIPWEDVTSNNSLQQVAKLHCGIDVDKSKRTDFLSARPTDIFVNMQDYISYCSQDVTSTYEVFKHVFPLFRAACPSPVTIAGILTMGSSLLPVNGGWEDYIKQAEDKFRELEQGVKTRLVELAERAKILMSEGTWQEDPWLSQLDWSPKKPRRSRAEPCQTGTGVQQIPKWYEDLMNTPPMKLPRTMVSLLKLECNGYPVLYSKDSGWHYECGGAKFSVPRVRNRTGNVQRIFSSNVANVSSRGGHNSLHKRLVEGNLSDDDHNLVLALARDVLNEAWEGGKHTGPSDEWLEQLDWKPVWPSQSNEAGKTVGKASGFSEELWPKWYWELFKPRSNTKHGSLEISVRSRVTPLLMKLKWQKHPLFFSREHGWIYRVPSDDEKHSSSRKKPLFFSLEADELLRQSVLSSSYVYYKLPHKDGESGNVGSPLGKSFGKYLEDGTLSSPEDTAKRALDLNAQCSYWISARDRVVNQLVKWHDPISHNMGFEPTQIQSKWGLILPQVVTMGTVTRRAIEKTWLTASNAKKDRVGSELKAMVQAPPGYVFVGADVDSEELWISSLIGDSQFGFHGSTAISWMTLEGTKASRTDLHSKTASILGITRDAAKVFNYSRIYGAGMRHAQQLLLQSNSNMLAEAAGRKATELYTATKGRRIFDTQFGQRLWIGGSESFLFNKLEQMALSPETETPVLGCRITSALKSRHLPTGFGSDYLPSRINWAVQSSGVDYLHLLIVAMNYLIQQYNIKARYLISIHDELRYLVHIEDKYRATLALQIANLWTRCQFAYRLGMDDLPQAVAFFSSVDIDTVLRKDVSMTCQTPSHTRCLPEGESLDIAATLQHLEDLGTSTCSSTLRTPSNYVAPDVLSHRSPSLMSLQAQATDQLNEVRSLEAMPTVTKKRISRKTM